MFFSENIFGQEDKMASSSSKSKNVSVLDEDGNPTHASGRGQLYEKMSPKGAGVIRFGFVWFNYSDYNIKALKNLTRENNVEYIVFNHEVCPTTGKKHLQGFCRLVKKKVFGTIKKLFEECGGDTVEICKCILNTAKDTPYITYSKKLESADPEFKIYYHKDDTRDPERFFSYFAKLNKDPEKEEINKKPGCRNDLNTVIEWINDNPNEDWLIVMQTWPEQCARYNKFFLDYWTAKKTANKLAQYKKDDDKIFGNPNFKLLKHQQYIFDIIIDGMNIFNHEDELIRNTRIFDNREIIWIYDDQTGRGKTQFIDFVDWYSKGVKNFDCCILNNAKTSDIAHTWKGEPIVFLDFTKSNETRINYGVLEMLKNGRIYSGKYNSHSKQGRPCFLCCMANFLPEEDEMGIDRWKIIYLFGGDKKTMSQKEFALSTEFKVCNLNEAYALKNKAYAISESGNKQLAVVKSKLQKAVTP